MDKGEKHQHQRRYDAAHKNEIRQHAFVHSQRHPGPGQEKSNQPGIEYVFEPVVNSCRFIRKVVAYPNTRYFEQ